MKVFTMNDWVQYEPYMPAIKVGGATLILTNNEKQEEMERASGSNIGTVLTAPSGLEVTPGDRIILTAMRKIEREVDGKVLYFIKSSDIIAIVNK